MGGKGTKSFTVFFLTIYASTLVRRVTSDHYKLGVLLPYSKFRLDKTEGEPFGGRFYAAAVSLAVDRVNKEALILPNTTITFIWNNTECNRTKMIKQQQWQIQQGVVAFVGPSCYAKKAVHIAGNHDLAVVSFGSQNPSLSNKQRYPNFARTNPLHYKSAPIILEILKTKGWGRVTIVEEDYHSWNVFRRYLVRRLRLANVKIVQTVKLGNQSWYKGPSNETAKKAINRASDATIFLSSFQQMQEIMTRLERMDMLKGNPGYGFIAANFRRGSVNNWIKYPFKWFFSMFNGGKYMKETKKAFKRLLLVTLKPDGEETETYMKFQQQLKKKSELKPFFSNAYKGCIAYRGRCAFHRANTKPPYTAAYLYDAVFQLSVALGKLQKEQKKPTGKNIVNKLKRKRFMSITDHEYKFDKNADVIFRYAVLGLKKDRRNSLNMLRLIWPPKKNGV